MSVSYVLGANEANITISAGTHVGDSWRKTGELPIFQGWVVSVTRKLTGVEATADSGEQSVN